MFGNVLISWCHDILLLPFAPHHRLHAINHLSACLIFFMNIILKWLFAVMLYNKPISISDCIVVFNQRLHSCMRADKILDNIPHAIF